MNVKVIKGDILNLDIEIDVIFHVANIRKTFGAGLAKQIKDQYPRVHQADVNYHLIGEERFGKYSSELVTYNDKTFDVEFFNLYAQDLFGDNLSESKTPFRVEYYIQALSGALNDLQGRFCKPELLAFPWGIGCGLSGGNFEYVKPITEQLVKEKGFDVVWVKYE